VEWFNELLWYDTVAHTIILYSIVIASGVLLGKLKIKGISLGITFVLFAGIFMGHLGFSANQKVVEFVRDFGLILFVFSVGLQVGPGFFSSFRRGGVTMNLMAVSVVLLGALTTLIIHILSGVSLPVMTGIMSGAVTNTPGLGAAQNALEQLAAGTGGGEVPDIGLGYAVAYPFGVLGIILTMILIRKTMGIDTKQELERIHNELHPADSMPRKLNIIVTNPLFFSKTVSDISKVLGEGVVISRVLHRGNLLTPTSATVIHENDILLVVTSRGVADEVVQKTGSLSEMDLSTRSGDLISRRLLVTNRQVSGKSLGSLKLRTRFNINITRIYRSGIEFIPDPSIELQMGDRLTVVGDEKSIARVTAEIGNSMKRLEEPDIVPIFVGILLGVILGSIPVNIPGLAQPLKLGMAGGPLIIAILLSRYGHKFSLVSYTTASANLMLREIGIVLFLASVGLKSGENFIPALISGDGLKWMGYGAIITLVPLLTVGYAAKLAFKRNYFEVCGLLSGSMTDPPALAFANSMAQSEAPSVAYATVYPLVMFLRIFVAQALILLFA